MKGRVKVFKKQNGFGFIHAEDGLDYFFHYSDIQKEGYKTCNEEDMVEFEPTSTEKGLKASKITILED